ncbi:hypothetical protein MKW94_011773 [Papaver nudicaule]|uniref:Uncharacterized protein n=1 Tax=Papaver nudicaule TaxID=74823 RepID=A0AA41V1H7_PAPNU|nr:hypothetical protein [Papaver nudicaule]
MALISISPSPSTNISTPKRPYPQISEDTEMQFNSSPPRKVIKEDCQGIIETSTHYLRCSKVLYRIKSVEESLFRITDVTGGETTIDVPYNKNHVHFDCPCGFGIDKGSKSTLDYLSNL